MPNSIKTSGEGLALQVTKQARSAGLVEENNDGEATRLAEVRVFSFDNLLLVVDRDTGQIKEKHVAELAASAARDTKSIHQAVNASLQIAGHGYQVQLPPARDAGFQEGDTAICQPAPGVLVIHRHSEDAARLAEDLASQRRMQVNKSMNHG